MSFFAPQAYTKETLSKAFDWLQHQPDTVRQVASTPDVLVNLYLKAQRQGLTQIDADAPVSSKKFFDDLKNLKKDFAPFDEAPRHVPMTPSAPATPVPEATAVTETRRISAETSVTTTTRPAHDAGLDEQSLESLRQIQAKFNLSSLNEALRMAVAVAAKHISRWE